MVRTVFLARRVDRELLDDSRTDNLALVEEADQIGDLLLFQVALDSATDQDLALGVDGTCVVRPDGQTACHAAVYYSPSRTTLTLGLTCGAAEDLELPERTALTLDVPDEDFQRLADGLAALWPGLAEGSQLDRH